MLAILSPAKTLDYETPLKTKLNSQPIYGRESNQLIKTLRTFEPFEVASLMKISDKLADLNHKRYVEWRNKPAESKTRPAALAFKGDVYQGLEAQSFNDNDLKFAQRHLRILSGLYGLLRPLDVIQPYRLEMGTKLKTSKGQNLYDYWGTKLTDGLNEALKESKEGTLVNLASNEYFGAVQPELLEGSLLNIGFKEKRNGQLKFVSFSAKKARGLMANFIIKERVKKPDDLKSFDLENYRFNAKMSSELEWTFSR
tara:strand:+ start:2624 stop:3388 length:765 start_codon:yes stop_codon:yes gene_type:complete